MTMDLKNSRYTATVKRYFSWSPTSINKAISSEELLLSRTLSLVSEDTSKPFAKVELIDIGEERFINTLTLKSQQVVDETKEVVNLVMNHGYGAGLGFYYKNYPAMALLPNVNVYSIDWLGMANSSRPEFPRKSRRMNEESVVQQSEDFFVDSLEDWRKSMKLEKMVLLGHSLGGYLSTKYALKYPERVSKLIMVSPAGIPERPADHAKPRGYFIYFLRKIWTSGTSPQSILRFLGPFGPRLVNAYTSRRFVHLERPEIDAIDSYIYHISAQKGSGEYCVARLLYPGAYAKKPLKHELGKLEMKVAFLYGDHDWMNHNHAVDALKELGMNKTSVAVIGNAGHHLYLDNHVAFDHAITCEMQGVKSGREDVVYAEV